MKTDLGIPKGGVAAVDAEAKRIEEEADAEMRRIRELANAYAEKESRATEDRLAKEKAEAMASLRASSNAAVWKELGDYALGKAAELTGAAEGSEQYERLRGIADQMVNMEFMHAQADPLRNGGGVRRLRVKHSVDKPA